MKAKDVLLAIRDTVKQMPADVIVTELYIREVVEGEQLVVKIKPVPFLDVTKFESLIYPK